MDNKVRAFLADLEVLLTLSVWGAMGFASYCIAEYIEAPYNWWGIGWGIACFYTIFTHYEKWWHTIISWVVFMCLSLAFAKFGIDGWWWLILLPFPLVSWLVGYRVSSDYEFDKMSRLYRKEREREKKEKEKKEIKNIASNALDIRKEKDEAKPKENNLKIKRILLAVSRYGGKFRNYITSPKKTPMAQSVDERMISTVKWVGGLLIGAILALCACIVFCEYKDETSRYQKSGSTLIDTETNSVLIRRGKEWKWEPIKNSVESKK